MSIPKIKIIVLGDTNVGKTALVEALVKKKFDSDYHCSTIGVEFASKTVKIGDKNTKAYIWDTAGQESYRSLITNYYRDCHGAIIVFDVTDIKSFRNIKYWRDELRKHNPGKHVEEIIIANKIDKASDRIVTKEMIERFCSEEGIQYIETSAKKLLNTDRYFHILMNNIAAKKYASLQYQNDVVRTQDPQETLLCKCW